MTSVRRHTLANQPLPYAGSAAIREPTSMFLSQDEIQELTGYQQAARQSRWLIERQIQFERNHRGLVVMRSSVEQHFANGSRKAAPSNAPGPNWSAVFPED